MKIPKFLFFLFFLAFSFCKEVDEDLPLDKNLEKAIHNDTLGNYEKAFYYYDKSYEYNQSINFNRRMAYCLLQQATIQNKLCDYNGAQESITRMLPLNKYLAVAYKTNALNSLGTSYLNLEDYEEALEAYQEVIKIAEKEITKEIAKNNIAVVYLEQKKYKEAILILEPLHLEDTLNTDKVEYARVIDNLGFAYFNQGKKIESSKYFLESLKIKDSIAKSVPNNKEFQYEKIAPLIHLARFYKDSIVLESNKYAKEAYEIATAINSPDDRLESLDILIRNAIGEKETKNLYFKYNKIKDSIDFIRKKAKNEFSKLRFDSKKAIEEREIQKTQKIIYLLLVFIVLLSSLYIFFHIKRKNKIKLQIENQKTVYETETRISKKLHDELANDVFQTLSFVQTQELETNRESLINNLDEIYKKTRNISRENNDIATGKDFEEDFLGMIANFQDDKVNIIINKEEANLNQIADEKQIALYRVIRELLVNMKKYSQASLVVLNFTLDKELKINYSDNGKGFEKKKSPGGLQSAENRILALNGTITFDTMPGKGLKVSIIIPKN